MSSNDPISSTTMPSTRAAALRQQPELGIGIQATISGAVALAVPDLRIDGPRSIFLAANGGLGDLCLALQVLLAFRAQLDEPAQHEWAVALPGGWQPALRPLIDALGVFDVVGRLDHASALLADLAHAPLILPSLLANNDDDARLALASTAGYLWARWGMASPYAPLRGSPEVAGLRATLRRRFAVVRRRLGMPASGELCVIAPESNYLGALKAWPLVYWHALIEQLHQSKGELPGTVVVCARPETFAQIRGELGSGVVHFDYTDPRLNGDLCNLASVIAASEFTVSLDSGTAHLASLLETPCVTLWGPTAPAIYASPNTTALRTSLCPPCSADVRATRCDDNVCMKNIAPETVVRVLRRLSTRIRAHG